MNREEKKALTRQKITEAALELFERQGFEETTVQQIAEIAGVAKGTFFNYFASKEDLILELQGLLVLQQMEGVVGKPGPIIPRLQSILFDFAKDYPMNRSVTRTLLTGLFGSSRTRGAQLDRCADLRDMLSPLIAHAQSRGEVRADLSAETIAQLAVQTYFGVLMAWANEQGEPELADQMALSFEVFVTGVSS